MASLLHEAVVELLRNRPQLSLELLDRATPLPTASRELLGTKGRVESVDLGDAKPLELRRRLVGAHRHPDASAGARARPRGRAMGGTTDRRRTLRFPAGRRWSRLNSVARRLPRGARESRAGRSRRACSPQSPEVLRIAAAALDAVVELDETRARFYSELVLQWLPAAARAFLEATIDIKTEFISDYTREKIAQGHAKGRAEALLHVLGARGISVDDAASQRIRSCTDIAVLDSWLERAVSARTADELFA